MSDTLNGTINRRNFISSLITVAAVCAVDRSVFAFDNISPKTDGRIVVPDLSKINDQNQWDIIDRTVTTIDKDGRLYVQFDEGKEAGLAIAKTIEFSNGDIEFDTRGRNVLQKSFVGIVFHLQERVTCDIIYFRPFNFKSDDAERRSHGVQYVSAPDFTWQRLRKEHPGQYEQPVSPVPDPDGWFHSRVHVAKQHVSVFVNDSSKPCLDVDKLNQRQSGQIALFVGSDSNGEFANLKIRHA